MFKQHPEYPLLISDDGKVTLLDGTEVKPFANRSTPHGIKIRIPMPVAKRCDRRTGKFMCIECYVKKLVAECFMEIPDYKYAIVNIDGDIWNNKVENLELVPMSVITGKNVKVAINARRTEVEIDGIKYPSVTIAAAELAPKVHYSKHTIAGFLSRIKYHKEKPCDTKFKIEHHVVLYEKPEE